MVDKTRLDQMLSNLGRYVGVLRELSRIPEAEFAQNPDKIGNAKYHFVIAIECCIDVAHHVIASENLRFPRDNADSFAVLADAGYVSEDLRDPLRAMARFRNRLVHVYWDVEDRLVMDYLRTSLSDFDRFSRQIAERSRD